LGEVVAAAASLLAGEVRVVEDDAKQAGEAVAMPRANWPRL
jgi:hypothetical protein